jgi:hypothetical protein
MIQAAAALGYDLAGHLGTQVTAQMLDWADLVLGMDSTVLSEHRKLAGDRARPELRLYAEGRDVPDPWGQDAYAFSACAQLIEDAARQQARQAARRRHAAVERARVPGGGQDRVSEPLGSVRAALRPRGGGNRRPARGIGHQRP